MKKKKRSSKPKKTRSKSPAKPVSVSWAASKKFAVPIPKHEKERLAELETYHILDTPAEPDFDRLAQLAADICGTPIALISLIDKDRQWFKSKVGLRVRETSRDYAFCAHAIMKRKVFIVQDTREDARFQNNPLVQSSPKIRFYAGAPLVSPENHALGTVCVIDRVPRRLDASQLKALETLRDQVMAQLSVRREMLIMEETMEKSRQLEAQFKKEIRLARSENRSYRNVMKQMNQEVVSGVERLHGMIDKMRFGKLTGAQKRRLDEMKLALSGMANQGRDHMRLARLGKR